MIQPQLILHIGAPKCGSSTLQTALTKMPDMMGTDGRQYRYVSTLVHDSAAAKIPFTFSPLYGASVTRAGERSPYGYACCPNMSNARMVGKFTKTVRMAYANGIRQNHIPILSNEGWIQRPAEFAKILKALGNPPVDVVAFLRPPLEWLNASFWQWGVWGTPNLAVWMDRSKLTYSFGADLKAWSQIPNVRLKVYPSKPDIVTHFAGLYGLPLEAGHNTNRSSPPVLIGFLLRNRRFRPTAHQSSIDFIVQRWCPKINTRQPWAVGAAHVHRFRPVVQQNIAILREILPADACDRLFADPRWLAEKPYHEELMGGVSLLNDPTNLPLLLESLQKGISNAGGQSTQHSAPPDTASLADWDAVISDAMDQLILCDKLARQRSSSISRSQKMVEYLVSAIRHLGRG